LVLSLPIAISRQSTPFVVFQLRLSPRHRRAVSASHDSDEARQVKGLIPAARGGTRPDWGDGGLVAKGGPLKWFAVAGADKKFVWADAKIEGDAVVVSSPKVPQPVAVRYAWADNPEGCNLYNGEDLPAAPFRTDSVIGCAADVPR
jgi:hypothetical protein